MRVLLVNQFYPPDVAPTGEYLDDLAGELAARGHQVSVVCSKQSYAGEGTAVGVEQRDGVRVLRLPGPGVGGRATGALFFHLAALARLASLREAFDLTVSLTSPPLVGWTVGRALRGRAGRTVHWVMDLYPDILVAHGALAPDSLPARALRAAARRQFARTSLVLTPGARMKSRVAPYLEEGTPVEDVPLWGTVDASAVDPAAVASRRAELGWKPEDTVLQYSGNMGLGHRLEDFLEAARQLGPNGPVWAFVGGGRRADEPRRFSASHPGARVVVHPYVDRPGLGASLAAADVHLVSLRGPWSGLIVPSKLQAAFALGRPVIYVGPRDSEPAEWVQASGGGWLVEEGDLAGLLQAVREAVVPATRKEKGEAARRFAGERFSRRRGSGRVADLLEQAAASNRATIPLRTPMPRDA